MNIEQAKKRGAERMKVMCDHMNSTGYYLSSVATQHAMMTLARLIAAEAFERGYRFAHQEAKRLAKENGQ
jgi:hypothetical protein